MWCVPKIDGEYVARSENVPDLYAEAPDPKRPVVCFDESPTQLIGEVRQPIPAKRADSQRMPWAEAPSAASSPRRTRIQTRPNLLALVRIHLAAGGASRSGTAAPPL
jgi:hypothetical protein